MSDFSVQVWEEKISIPTYGIGKPDKNPMFFEKRVYQGSSGVVYPNPVIEKILDEKKDEIWDAVFLENQYLKIMILPQLGGRVQMAYDKVGKRHFIYYNQVIKPALVGLCGPWISGGIEFNWPQHHRPSTYEAVDFTIEENADGSKTVWVNEVEKMFRTKGMAGFTLYPDKAYLEIKGKLYNRTPLPQTFLWWANPAVKVNDHYQSVFPPDVHAVFDHGKRDVSDFPIATGVYYKVDYAPGTDISRYKNIPVPTSYMAIRSDYDFVGGYENDAQAGVLHVANHHISPGKKQWTWGHSDFGRAWDKNLTDEDGPYIELMTGVYTDNQPDFSWLMPYEEKSFTQYFMPYRELGVVKNATKDLLLYTSMKEGSLEIKIFATGEQAMNTLELFADGQSVYRDIFSVSPRQVYNRTIPLPAGTREESLLVMVNGSDGKEKIRYQAVASGNTEIPSPASAALPPEAVENNEQLYLTGLHLEQYRHATYNAADYYAEALRRDPKDARNNNALGAWLLRRGQFSKAEPYFRKAVETLTRRNPNPYDGEPLYNLGLCLEMQGRYEEAYDQYYKAVWNSAWQDSGYFSLARLSARRGRYEEALEQADWSLDRNARNNKAWTLKAAILRKTGRYKEALEVCSSGLRRDLFNLSLYFEQQLSLEASGNVKAAALAGSTLVRLGRDHDHNFLEYAGDYAAAGLYEEAIGLLGLQSQERSPMHYYYLGWFYRQGGQADAALQFFRQAAAADPALCFPNRIEDIPVLQLAMELNPQDAKAPYYLGCLWYDKRQYDEAIAMWEESLRRDGSFPTVHRNLGIALFNKRNNAATALQHFEKAFALDTSDARVLMELDQLRKRLNADPGQRLAFLEAHPNAVNWRDDLYLERAALHNFLGRHEHAFGLIMQRRFHPWEGGEGKVSGQYCYSLTALARQDIVQGNYKAAIEKLEQARVFPDSLGEGKLYGAQENDIFYWLGKAYDGMNDTASAQAYFRKATEGQYEPAAAMYYNDQPPEKIFYQGLAWEALGQQAKAAAIFRKLIDYGEAHGNDEVKIDYFAVSLPDLLIFEDDLSQRNAIHCEFMKGLGYLGLKETASAVACFRKVLGQGFHPGAKTHLNLAREMQAPAAAGNEKK
ncbi:DUF5107 domain-containing protein [Chitinophaga sp. YIM B06452]|uniref:DUF5107 domain-containing protein n=1 Tax=Chitinophaga sp. YIM B06452 TaxID=3082158 RepID=UPI0031FEF893